MKKYSFLLLLPLMAIYFYTKNKNSAVILTLNDVEISKDFYTISAKITNTTNEDIIIKDLMSPLENSIKLINVNRNSSHLSALPHSNSPINTWKLLKNSTTELSLGYQGNLCKGDNFLVLKMRCNDEIIESNVKNIFTIENFETSEKRGFSFPGVIEPVLPEKSLSERLFDHTQNPNSKFYIID